MRTHQSPTVSVSGGCVLPIFPPQWNERLLSMTCTTVWFLTYPEQARSLVPLERQKTDLVWWSYIAAKIKGI